MIVSFPMQTANTSRYIFIPSHKWRYILSYRNMLWLTLLSGWFRQTNTHCWEPASVGSQPIQSLQEIVSWLCVYIASFPLHKPFLIGRGKKRSTPILSVFPNDSLIPLLMCPFWLRYKPLLSIWMYKGRIAKSDLKESVVSLFPPKNIQFKFSFFY